MDQNGLAVKTQGRSANEIVSLQTLRAMAAIFVFLYHVSAHFGTSALGDFWRLFRHGYCGVDIFFVLSGFILSLSSESRIHNNSAWVTFGALRLIRIYPTYWLFLCCPVFVTVFLSRYGHQIPQVKNLTPTDLFELLLLLPNHPRVSQVTWTLSYELYFYLIFLTRWLHRQAPAALLIVLASAGAMGFRSFFTSSFLLEFLLGMFAYQFWRVRRPSFKLGFILVATGTAMIITSCVYGGDSLRAWRVQWFGFAAFLLVLGLASIEFPAESRLVRMVSAAGDASYVFYLIHSPLVSVGCRYIRNTFDSDSGLFLLGPVFLLLFTQATAIILHVRIERPILSRLRRMIVSTG